MKVIEKIAEFKKYREFLLEDAKKGALKQIGLVPTMGALHAGHESLIQKCRDENDVCVLSLFVNPTQFNDPVDFQKYPSTWEQDLSIADRNKVDILFHPSPKEMYLDDYKYKVIETDFSRFLCGKNRPGHFDGVLTVVMKLFQIIKPHRAYFGEKDFQQVRLVEGMIQSFFLDIELVRMPTIREESGLAMSSRNQRLRDEKEKLFASSIYQTLIDSSSAEEAWKKLELMGFRVDYVEDREDRRFAAVYLNSVRLIDNVSIKK